MKACWKADVLQCECVGKRIQVAPIQQSGARKEVLVHLGLPAELVTRGDPPVVSVRGPPTALFPRDVSEAGELLLESDEGPPAAAADLDLPFFDEVLAA